MSITRLFDAIDAGNLQITRKLLEGKEGTDVDAIRGGRHEWTPLHKACECLRLRIVKFLILEKKVDVKTLDKNGWTPLHLTCAVSYRNLKAATEIGELLLTNGANVNTKATSLGSGETALHKACYHGSIYNLIQMLLSHGAHINAVNGSGETPLHFACDLYTPRDAVIKFAG